MHTPSVLILFSLLSLSWLQTACTSPQKTVQQPLPQWVKNKPDNTTEKLYFTGSSGQQSNEQEAHQSAENDALTQFARYCDTDIEEINQLWINESNQEFSQKNRLQRTAKTSARIGRAEVKQRHLQLTHQTYQAYVLISLPKTEIGRVKNRRALKQARSLFDHSQHKKSVLALNDVKHAIHLLDGIDFTGLNEEPSALRRQWRKQQRTLKNQIDSRPWRVAVINTNTHLTLALLNRLKKHHPKLLVIDCAKSAQHCLKQSAEEGAKQLTLIQTSQEVSENSMRFTRANLTLQADNYAVCSQKLLESLQTQGRILSPFGEENLDWSVAADKLLPPKFILQSYSDTELSCD
jgi:hypothetical protein